MFSGDIIEIKPVRNTIESHGTKSSVVCYMMLHGTLKKSIVTEEGEGLEIFTQFIDGHNNAIYAIYSLGDIFPIGLIL